MILKKILSLLKGYEKIVFSLRRHPFVFFLKILFFLILFIVPLVFYLLIINIFPYFLENTVVYALAILLGSIYYLSIWLFLYTSFIDYYLDVWTITNDRLINVKQQGIFSRTISELDLYKIQDVTSEIKGFFPTLLNYGNIYVQTAGERERFILEQIPNPHQIREKILKLAEEDRKYHQKSINSL